MTKKEKIINEIIKQISSIDNTLNIKTITTLLENRIQQHGNKGYLYNNTSHVVCEKIKEQKSLDMYMDTYRQTAKTFTKIDARKIATDIVKMKFIILSI